MTQYNVTGMSCAACSARVEKAVSRVPGVTSCSVSLLTNSMGVEGTERMTQAEYRKAAVDAVRQLSKDVGIPQDLKAIVKEQDVKFLAESAMADACRPGNPKDPTLEDIIGLYHSLM